MNTFLNKARFLQDFIKINNHINQRASAWAHGYRKYLVGKRETPPFPPVIQIIPTEYCNLRCPMCNQWGEKGYYPAKKRPAGHMPIEELLSFLGRYLELRGDYTLSVHGGEPFVYKDMPALLDFIGSKKIDTLFSTNGVLLGRFADQLATINRHVFYLLSIDGGEETNDRIRGKGVTRKIMESISTLREKCLEKSTGLPKIFINYTICEHNSPEDVDEITKIARQLQVYIVNYNLRWFLPNEKGEEYNEILEKEFNVRPTNAWVGWVTSDRFEGIDRTIDRVYKKKRIERLTLRPPFSTMIPNFLTRDRAKQYYHNYNELFGMTSCIMPSYWARIHSTGELIYCPGHPDIIPGNVFERPFAELFLNKVSWQIRKRMETKLFPICNRCCGLYMTYPATRRLQEVSDTMKFYPTPVAKESRFFSRYK